MRVPTKISERAGVIRLAMFVGTLAVIWLVVITSGIIDVDRVRAWIESAGPLAPIAYVFVAAALALIFVPGPILAAASGFLFGPVLGTVVTLTSTVCTAVAANLLGRKGGRDGARSLLGEKRVAWLDDQVRRRGLWAVAGQRFIPGMSDAMASYTFGALGVPIWQMAVGSAIGSAPRAFVYTALGSVVDEPSVGLTVAAVVIWVIIAIVGAETVRRMFLTWRRHRRATDDE